jgi:hypothetical protein
MPPTEFESAFDGLRAILKRHADGLKVTDDTPGRYCLEGNVGPATIRAWGGQLKRPLIPVAWVEIRKSYVSYHLMGVYANPKLLDHMSKELQARMQGNACFNFTAKAEASLAEELEQLTARAVAWFRAEGFTT